MTPKRSKPQINHTRTVNPQALGTGHRATSTVKLREAQSGCGAKGQAALGCGNRKESTSCPILRYLRYDTPEFRLLWKVIVAKPADDYNSH